VSEIILDTITGKSTATTITIGSTPVVSASANSMTIRGEGSNQTSIQQGLLKAWGNFDGSGTVGTNDSFNMDSLTDNGTGNYTVSITNDLANANGCMSGYSIMDGLVYGDSSNVSSAGTFQMRVVVGSSNSLMDPDEFHVQIAGDLS